MTVCYRDYVNFSHQVTDTNDISHSTSFDTTVTAYTLGGTYLVQRVNRIYEHNKSETGEATMERALEKTVASEEYTELEDAKAAFGALAVKAFSWSMAGKYSA